jgi:hypothetical protein
MTVQILIGKLVTDDAFRRRFEEDRAGVVMAMSAIGPELTALERESILNLDLSLCERFAASLDSRIRAWSSGTEDEAGARS